jgi:predicted dehydrogenase
MKKKHVALIGYGYWGQKIYRYLRESEDFLVRYVFFRGLKSLSRYAINQKYGSEFVSKIDLILDDETVPNVIIATPINTHYDLAKKALMKYKNVLVEKPLATDPIHCKDLINIAQQNELILETEYTYTYSESLANAEKMIRQGVIGNVKSIILTKKQLGRFLPYDVYALLGTHFMSILDMFVPIDECEFYPKPLMTNNGLTTAATIFFETKEKNCSGYIDISLHCPVRETKVIIYGDKGTMVFDPDATETLSLTCYAREQTEGNKVNVSSKEVYSSNENHNLKLALENFSEVIEKKKPDNRKRALCITDVISSLSK